MVSDAPGLKIKRNKDGTVREYWCARSDIVRRGFTPSTVRLHYPDTPEGREQLAARCRRLQAQMLAWNAAGDYVRPGYTGTIKSLAALYASDADSPYRRLAYSSQVSADYKLRVITETVGDRALAALTGRDFLRWHRRWQEPAKSGGRSRPARARACITQLRIITSWGAAMGWRDCERANAMLGKLRFETLPARELYLQHEHVSAVCGEAHAACRPSVALAQLLMFWLGMRQKDVIGEWIPNTGDDGGIVHGGKRWVKGLTWSDIDANLVLRKKTSKNNTPIEHDLKLYDEIVREISLISPDRRIGPVVVDEHSGRPYRNGRFSHVWREIARAAGLPDELQSRDSRSGAITDAYSKGADESDIMQSSGHKTVQMSRRYNRRRIEQSSRVARLRTGNTD